jgi:glycine/D-amino acid oxidase-like deaminating enzyme
VSTPSPDVIVIGAGIVGASCADTFTGVGLRVAVVERGGIASGTTSGGEGNILVSDKEPGPELELALLSARLWVDLADDLGAEALEYDPKGGVVVARTAMARTELGRLTATQRAHGVDVVDLAPADVVDREPNITRDITGGAHYPQDAQVQPMLATSALLRRARGRGAEVYTGTSVTGFVRDATGEIAGVVTSSAETPRLTAPWVINAAGTWAGAVGELAGTPLPILPRRGFILVTEPLPRVVRHKVYTADYVANVASSDAGLETSVVIEGTRGGTVLIGASRERVGFDRTVSIDVLRRLAFQAVGLFPFLAEVSLLRTYLGFRPYCPDHLPVIGEDPRAPGLLHAAGHEGAGIGLAAATAHLLAQHVIGRPSDLDLAPFSPGRFASPDPVPAASGVP